MNVRDEIAQLARFMRAPRRWPTRPANDPHWVARALLFATLVLAFNIATGPALDALRDWAQLTEDLPTRLSTGFVLLAVVFAPISEELVFRAGLRRVGYTLFIGPALIAACYGAFEPRALWVAAGLALFALAVFVTRTWRSSLVGSFAGRFAWVFWGYAGLFALAHIGNYEWDSARGVVVPLLVLPQFVVGTVAGYLRLRDGLRSSMLLHAVNNAVAVTLLAW